MDMELHPAAGAPGCRRSGLWHCGPALGAAHFRRRARRGQAYREQEQKTREQLARAESVFGAHPGVIMVWEDDEPAAEPAEPGVPQPRQQKSEWGVPSLYGSPVALMGILRFADDGSAMKIRACASSKASPTSKPAMAPARTRRCASA